MNQRHRTLLGAFAVAVTAVACAPNDADIGTKVRTELTSDETVKAARIDVGVDKKIVTLSGTVDNSAIKSRAAEVARKTQGVTDVIDQITVRSSGFNPGSEHGPGAGHGPGMMGGESRGEHQGPSGGGSRQ